MSLPHAFKHNWHPCSQMKDYEDFPWLHIEKAKGSTLYLKDGRQIVDAISSWWCKSLGHGHPELKEALIHQSNQFEHVIFANTSSDLAIEFGEKITRLTTSLDKCFYSGDGSTAVEIALKLSLQYHQQTGHLKKTKFAFLKNSYHGETALCYSVSDLGLYKDKFKSILNPSIEISNFSYIYGTPDIKTFPEEMNWHSIEDQLNKNREYLTAIIVEPIVQGASGMQIYSADLLKKLRGWCTNNNVHLIADEIMTGLGRIGNVFACDYAQIEPDFYCLMKGLCAGWVPFSVVLTSSNIYNAFYDDYHSSKAFMHSNTFTGNALGMAIANKVLDIYQREDFYSLNKVRGKQLWDILNRVGKQTDHLTHYRQIGMICAAELVRKDGTSFNSEDRTGYQVYKQAIHYGALIRPLGDTIYLLPPYNITDKELDILEEALIKAIEKVTSKNE